MNKFLLTAVLACTSLTLPAQSKINPAGRLMMYNNQIEHEKALKAGDGLMHAQSTDSDERVTAVVSLNDGYDSSVFTDESITVLTDLGDMLIINLPISMAGKVAETDAVKSMSFGGEMRPMMDFARASADVNSVHSGFSYDGQKMSFDGTGVIVGLMDTGLDANHVNFKNDNGTSRIQRLWHMTGYDGTCSTYTADNISTFTTDNSSESHATHVAGILGGSYKGNGTYYYVSSPSGYSAVKRSEQPIPYYGVATGADLAFSVGALSYPNILMGVMNIVEYAEALGRPAVINMSLGSTNGPHDGTDTYSAFLSRLGERAIICMSAGNDGDANISLSKKITSSTGNNSMLKTFVADGTGNGAIDLWADDNQTVSVKWCLYNVAQKQLIDIISTTAAGESVSTAGNTTFRSYFSGTIEMTSNLDPNNNRYNVYSSLSSVQPANGNTTHALALVAEGPMGQTLYVYGNSNAELSNRPFSSGSTIVGFTNGTAANSINDAACAANILSVGSYNSRISWGRLDGQVYGYNESFAVDGISPFSSYGTSFQGTKLPLVAAPGAGIVSSYSRFYVGNRVTSASMTAQAIVNNVTNYWGNNQGTSMSCPFVTGVVGLWLQADPTLDFDGVMDVINNTSTYNSLTMRDGRWGAGKINALEGIKYVLENRAAIGTVWADDAQRMVVTASADGYEVYVAGEKAIEAGLYDLQGRKVSEATGTDGTANISTVGLTKGVYVLTAEGSTGRHSTRILVK